MQQQTRILS